MRGVDGVVVVLVVAVAVVVEGGMAAVGALTVRGLRAMPCNQKRM